MLAFEQARQVVLSMVSYGYGLDFMDKVQNAVDSLESRGRINVETAIALLTHFSREGE